ncbi:MAG TPA: type II secretion system protein [Verrucomicrobiae bacterium]|nr:type II secretion system protein [Verrucomicrobiae bacterium]
MTRNFSKANDGFTLVESVMAVMILGVALGACVLSFSMAMKVVGTSSNQMAALHYARDQMEVLRTNSFDNLVAGLPVISVPTNFAVSYSVSTVDSATKNITVNVTYLNRIHGGTSTNTLTSSVTSTLHS